MSFDEEYEEITKVHQSKDFPKKYVKEFSKKWNRCCRKLQKNSVDLSKINIVVVGKDE